MPPAGPGAPRPVLARGRPAPAWHAVVVGLRSRVARALLARYSGRALTLALLLCVDAAAGAVRLADPPATMDAGEHRVYLLLYLTRLGVLTLTLVAPRTMERLFVPLLALLTTEILPISAMLDDPALARTQVTIVVALSAVVALLASLRGLVAYLAVACAVVMLLVVPTSAHAGSAAVETSYSLLGCVFPALALHRYRTRLAEAREAAEALARADPLTGALNRRGLQDRLVERVGAARREGRVLWLLVLDLDHFKQVNDQHGHQAGDEVIRLAARGVQQAVRAGDVLARTGGEEFVVVARGDAAAHAQGLAGYAHRVRSALVRATAGYGVTASVGAAAAPPPAEGEEVSVWFDELAGRADGALYDAKRAGRDRVVLAEEPVAPRGTAEP